MHFQRRMLRGEFRQQGCDTAPAQFHRRSDFQQTPGCGAAGRDFRLGVAQGGEDAPAMLVIEPALIGQLKTPRAAFGEPHAKRPSSADSRRLTAGGEEPGAAAPQRCRRPPRLCRKARRQPIPSATAASMFPIGGSIASSVPLSGLAGAQSSRTQIFTEERRHARDTVQRFRRSLGSGIGGGRSRHRLTGDRLGAGDGGVDQPE